MVAVIMRAQDLRARTRDRGEDGLPLLRLRRFLVDLGLEDQRRGRELQDDRHDETDEQPGRDSNRENLADHVSGRGS